MSRATLGERTLARRLWRTGWTIGAVGAASLAMLGLDSRAALGTGPWVLVLALVAVAAAGLALSWRSPLYGGIVVAVCGAALVPIVLMAAEGNRRLALAMVSAPFAVSGVLVLVAAWLVTDRGSTPPQ